MGYWDCPKCAAENSLDANSCWRCGFRHFGEGREPAAAENPTPPATAAISRLRDRLREDLRKGVGDALERDRATIDRLARTPSDRAGGGKHDQGS